MVVTSSDEAALAATFKADSEYDRASELKAFDAGITEIPRIFHNTISDNYNENSSVLGDTQFSVPVIDLEGLTGDSFRRKEIIKRVREASESWGLFQIINHGIPDGVMEEMKMEFIVSTSKKLR